MQSIKLIIAAVLVMTGMSVMGQWTDGGTYTHTTDAIGIGYTANPHPSLNLGLSVSTESFMNGNIYMGGYLKAYNTDQRFVFGFGGAKGANAEFYSSTHGERPGQLRFVFGGNGFGDTRFMHYNGSAWTTNMIVNYDGRVGIGTETPTSTLDVNGKISTTELAVNGKIISKEVEVTIDGWPDYVFEEDYKLSPLSDVEKFINDNKHLPGVPSQKEVKEKGIELGEMNKVLIEKVEELTLYIIQLEKRINSIETDTNN